MLKQLPEPTSMCIACDGDDVFFSFHWVCETPTEREIMMVRIEEIVRREVSDAYPGMKLASIDVDRYYGE